MNKAVTLFLKFFLHAPTIYLIFCTGIVYALFLWPLALSIFSISLSAYWLLFCKKDWPSQYPRNGYVWLFISLFLVFAAGLLFSENLGSGMRRIEHQLPILLFPVVLGFSRALQPRHYRFILGHYVIATISAAVLGFLIALWLKPQALYTNWANGHVILYPQSYSYVMGLETLMAIVLLAENNLPSWLSRPALRYTLITVLGAYVLILNVRLVSACGGVLLLYYICRLVRGTAQRIVVAAVLIVLVVLAFWRIPALSGKWQELSQYREKGVIALDKDASLGRDWGGTSIRVALWTSSRELIFRHLFTGVGTGDVQDSLQQAYEDHQFYFASRYNHYNIHNQYLNMLLVAGITGLVVLIACAVAALISLTGGMFARTRPLFLLLFLVICFTEVILDTSKGIVWYSLFNSIFAFGGSAEDQPA